MLTLAEYGFGHISVGESLYLRDLIVFEDEVHSPWVRQEGHFLAIGDLQWALKRRPDVIIIGTGSFGRLAVPKALIDGLSAKGISVLALRTADAVMVYNQRAKAEERVAACLHLTC